MYTWIVLLVIVAAAVWYFTLGNKASLPWKQHEDDALEVLKRRLVQGKISEYEYEEMKAALEEDER